MSFDATKNVQTLDGRRARIICTDLDGDFPIAAQVTHHNGNRQLYCFSASGKVATPHASYLDLINIPEEKWRPYTKAELKLGTEVVEKSNPDHATTVGSKSSLHVWLSGATVGISYKELFDGFTHTDGTPAGVKIQ